MTDLVPATATSVDLLDEADARALTDRIRDAAEHLWGLLCEAMDRQAWRALGYGSWSSYIEGEFDFGRRHAYRLVEQGRIIGELRATVTDVCPTGHTDGITVTEREARDIKPELPRVLDRVRHEVQQQTADSSSPTEPVARLVDRVVTEERDRITKRAADRDAIRRLDDDARARFGDPDDDEQLAAKFALFDAVDALARLEPDVVLGAIRPDQHYRLAAIGDALDVLTTVANLWEERHERTA